MLCNEANKNWIGSYAVFEVLQLPSVIGMSIFRPPTHCQVSCFQVYWADQLSSLWAVDSYDSCPNFTVNFTVEPWPSSIIFISMGDHRDPYQELALHLR